MPISSEFFDRTSSGDRVMITFRILPRRVRPVWMPVLGLMTCGSLRCLSQSLWINEFHYDNTGTDLNEFVEVAVPSNWTDLAAVRLTLYNGSDGRTYGTAHPLSTFTAGESVDGMTYYSKAISGLQNGAPDGLALDWNGELQDFVSYEGAFFGSAGPAAGALSVDVGFFEGDANPPGGSIGRTGEGRVAGDFQWASFVEASPGGINPGQTTVPEPGTGVLLLVLVVCLGLTHRRR